jgi:DNA-directed RNA polymerase subunit RPC12/RpoP
MAQTQSQANSSAQVPCSYHPNVMTGLRCSRCGKPICPQCAVRTPVGLRCPDCAGVRGLPTYRTPANSLVKAAGAALGVAVGTAVLWRFFPEWQFYFCLLMGFGVVETIARFSGNKRGADLQLLAVAIVTVGFVLSRVLLAQRFGITFGEINALDDQVINDAVIQEFGFRGVSVSEILQVQLIPDVVYMVIAYAIAWVRFR